MIRIVQIALLFAVMVISNPASSMSGAAFLELNRNYQNGYVLGLFNGFISISVVGDDAVYRQKTRKCLSNLQTDNEMAAAFMTWLRNRPQYVAQEVHMSFPRFIYETCPETAQ